MIPIFTLPIVEFGGRFIDPSGLPDISDPPMSSVFADKYRVLNLAVGDPRSYVSDAMGTTLVT